ncbi:MAG: hypothetical protein GX087_09250 [Desulfobulbaceae bacterium]|nr:hypothetical protein [Desulfobulbaceae bacterium]
MSIVKIVVADVVYTGAIKKELGPATKVDINERAELLAALKGTIASEWLETQYPEAELYADVAIYDGFGTAKPIEVFAYDESDALDKDLSDQLQRQVQEKVGAALQEIDWDEV